MMTIFPDRDEVETFQYLSGNDAQAFVDVIHEASTAFFYHQSMGWSESIKTSVPVG